MTTQKNTNTSTINTDQPQCTPAGIPAAASQQAHRELPDDLIDTRAAARLARTHVNTVRRWVFTHKIPGWRRGGRLFVSARDIKAMWKRYDRASEQAAAQAANPPLPNRRERAARD